MTISANETIETGIDKRIQGSGQIVAEYAASRSRLVNLMQEIASVADAFSGLAEHIRTAHAMTYGSAPGIDHIPDPDKVRSLVNEIAGEFEKKSRLADSLRALGVNVEVDSGFLAEPRRH